MDSLSWPVKKKKRVYQNSNMNAEIMFIIFLDGRRNKSKFAQNK